MEVITAPRSRMSGRPQWSADDAYLYLSYTEQFESFSVSGDTHRALAPNHFYVRDGRFQSRVQNDEVSLFGDQDRLYSYAISPDGSQVAYSTSGQKLWIADIDGGNRISLGNGMSPSWSPNGHWLTFMLNEDDGHSVTSSDIYIIKFNGSGLTKVTRTDDLIEMNPQWSPNGAWIVFDTDRLGQLFIQQMEWR